MGSPKPLSIKIMAQVAWMVPHHHAPCSHGPKSGQQSLPKSAGHVGPCSGSSSQERAVLTAAFFSEDGEVGPPVDVEFSDAMVLQVNIGAAQKRSSARSITTQVGRREEA